MRLTWFVVMGALFLCLQGCETAKGFQKDVKTTWGTLSKADDWIRENMW